MNAVNARVGRALGYLQPGGGTGSGGAKGDVLVEFVLQGPHGEELRRLAEPFVQTVSVLDAGLAQGVVRMQRRYEALAQRLSPRLHAVVTLQLDAPLT